MTWERREGKVLAPEGRELRGLALPYGVETTVHGVRERFESQAATSTGEAILNAYHRDDRPLAREPGTLFFESRADGFYLRAEQLRRALGAFGSEPDPTTRPNPSVPWWVS